MAQETNSLAIPSSTLSTPPPSPVVPPESVKSEVLKQPETATIVATTAKVTREANLESPLIVQLKKGDFVEILELQQAFAKIRYKLEGDFPVSGWIPLSALRRGSFALNSKGPLDQPYSPDSEQKKTYETKVESFPDQKFAEKVVIPKSDKRSFTLKSGEAPVEIIQQKPVAIARERLGFYQELDAQMGLQQWEDKYSTQKTDGSYYDSPFLSYDFTGLAIGISDELGMRLPEYTYGGKLSYQFTYFSESVDPSNDEIEKTNIQAQAHEIQGYGFMRKTFFLKYGIRVEPEAQVGFGTNIFLTNQLRDISPTNPSRLGQPVLMNLYQIFAKLNLLPAVYVPYDFKITPELGIILFNYFFEGPVLNSADPTTSIRTGEPEIGSLLLSYGGRVGWTMKKLQMPNSEIFAAIRIEDFSRSYSGAGNRAGMITNDVKSNSTSTTYAVGFHYNF